MLSLYLNKCELFSLLIRGLLLNTLEYHYLDAYRMMRWV